MRKRSCLVVCACVSIYRFFHHIFHHVFPHFNFSFSIIFVYTFFIFTLFFVIGPTPSVLNPPPNTPFTLKTHYIKSCTPDPSAAADPSNPPTLSLDISAGSSTPSSGWHDVLQKRKRTSPRPFLFEGYSLSAPVTNTNRFSQLETFPTDPSNTSPQSPTQTSHPIFVPLQSLLDEVAKDKYSLVKVVFVYHTGSAVAMTDKVITYGTCRRAQSDSNPGSVVLATRLDEPYNPTSSVHNFVRCPCEGQDRVRVSEWIRKLVSLDDNCENMKKKNEYIQFLRIQVTQSIIQPPFTKPPPDTELAPLPELLGNLMCEKVPGLPKPGPLTPCAVHKSPDGRAYISIKHVPGNGILCYMAVTPEPME